MRKTLVTFVKWIEHGRALKHMLHRMENAPDAETRAKYCEAYVALRKGNNTPALSLLLREESEINMQALILIAKGADPVAIAGLNRHYTALNYMREALEPAA